MDNANVGGNRGNSAEQPVDFEVLYGADDARSGETERDPGSGEREGDAGRDLGNTERGLGNTAIISEGVSDSIFEAAPAPEIGELSLSGVDMETGLKDAIEVKSLAEDGSTESKLGRLALELSGDVMDEASVKEVRKKLSDYKKDPFELMNYRDEAMVASLRDNYGRIFADDGNENEGNVSINQGGSLAV